MSITASFVQPMPAKPVALARGLTEPPGFDALFHSGTLPAAVNMVDHDDVPTRQSIEMLPLSRFEIT